MVTPRLRLGQLLVDARMITQDALERTLELQRTDGRRLGTLLVEQGLINETQLTQILSHQLAVPWVSLLHIEFSRQLLNLVPHDVAERYCLVPIYVRHVRNQGETLYVAMDDPTNEDGMKECMAYSGLPVRAMIAPPSDIRNAIRVYYGARARSVAPPSPARKVPASEPTSRAPAGSSPASSESGAAALSSRRAEEIEASPAPATKPEPLVSARLYDDTPPAIEATEVDEADVAVFEEEIEQWEQPPRPSRPTARPDERTRPTLKVEPPPELLAAAQPNRRAAGRPSARRDSAAPPPGEIVPSIDVGPAPSRPAAALLGAVLGRSAGAPSPPRPILEPTDDPPSEREVRSIPAPQGRGKRRMVSLTLLDGTTITLPARNTKGSGRRASSSASEPPPPPEDPGLTARDLVSALRAVSHGADASEILGNNMRWEAMFAALLSLLLKKHLIADWEFVDELKKI